LYHKFCYFYTHNLFTMKKSTFLILLFISGIAIAQSTSVRIGLLKYKGGGDWYANPTSLPNLVKFCNETLNTNIQADYVSVEPGSTDIFSCAFVHMTGHGNVIFSDYEAENLRNYLLSGGFLHIDDNYGMDEFVRRELKKVFPDIELVELPFDHPIYHSKFDFPQGLPKIHEHDNKAPQGFGIIENGRLLVFYSYECDLGDGWEDYAVHRDSEETHTKALQMGANIITYVFSQ